MATDRTPGGSFGSRLREARERRGVSLRQIANTTKISISALEALERNDIARLPGGIFSRAFVRSYALEVGLDPDEAIRDFLAQFPNDSVTAGHPSSTPIEDSEALESDRRMAETFLRLVAFSVPIAGLVVYLGTSGARKVDDVVAPPPQAPSRAIDIAEPVEARALEVPRAAAAAPPVFPDDRLTVGLSATAPCWVSAIVDGQRVIQRQLEPGERQVLDVRRELILTAGDAGALTVTLNGESTKPLGGSGQVVTTRLSLANFKTYLATP